MSRVPKDIMTESPARRRVSPRLPCPKCRKLCPIEMRICTCGHWLINPSVVTDKRRALLPPELDFVQIREAPSSLSSTVSREEEVLPFRETPIPIERDMDVTIQMPTMPRQMDEFFSLLTGTEPGELPEAASSAIPTVTSESHSPIPNRVSANEPSEPGEILSDSCIAPPTEVAELLSSPTPTTPRGLEDPFTIVEPATPNERDQRSAALNAIEARAGADMVAMSRVTSPTELERLFAAFSRPRRREVSESRATASAGSEVTWNSKAIGIGRIKKHLAAATLIIFAASLVTYLIGSFKNVSSNSEVSAQNPDDSRVVSPLQSTVVEADPGTKQGEDIQAQPVSQPSSEDRSLNRRVRGSTPENSPLSAASNPSRLAATKTTEPEQPASEKALPTKKQEKAEKKKVTVDELITNKKKITVDDLINDN